MKFWTPEEIELLKNTYHKFSTIQEKLNTFPDRTLKSIETKAFKLNLKNIKIRQVATAIKNKKIGRDLTYENIKQIASKFLCKTDFYIQDTSAYTTAARHGWIDEICSHMKFNVISMPQLILRDVFEQLFEQKCKYNTRLVIKPHEIDIYFPELKLGFEYNGIAWHKKDTNPNFKYNLCKKQNILLITINEKLEAKKYYEKLEKYLREEIKIKLSSINKWLNSKYEASDIDSIIIDYKKYFMNKEDVKSICDSYSDYTLFKKENGPLVAKLSNFNLLELFTSHMKRLNTHWDDNKASDVISKYNILGDLIKNEFKCYCWIKKHNKSYLLNHLIRRKYWSEEEIKQIINRYDNIKNLKKENFNCYAWIKTHKRYDLLDKFYK